MGKAAQIPIGSVVHEANVGSAKKTKQPTFKVMPSTENAAASRSPEQGTSLCVQKCDNHAAVKYFQMSAL